MGRNRDLPNDQRVVELEAALEAKTTELESLRADGVLGKLTHVFMVFLCTGGLSMLLISMLVGLIALFGLKPYISPTVAKGVGIVAILLSFYTSQKLVFVRKKGVDEMDQMTIDCERIKLEKQLNATRARVAKRDLALAKKQRATRGGDLSIAAPGADGGLEVHDEVEDGGLSLSERVVLDLDGEEREVEQVRVDHVVDEV